MEIKRSVISIFLLLLLLVLPRGRCQVAEPDIFEIDYRGPETHSSALPPPGGRSHGRPFIHGDQAAARNSNGNRQNAKKIHG